MSRYVHIIIKSEREKFPADRLRRFFKKVAERDPYLKEMEAEFAYGLREARKTGVFDAYFRVGRNQTERMGLLILLGRPEEAVLEETRLWGAIMSVFVEALQHAAEKTGVEMVISDGAGIITSKEDVEDRVATTELLVDIYRKLRKELKSVSYRKRLEIEWDGRRRCSSLRKL